MIIGLSTAHMVITLLPPMMIMIHMVVTVPTYIMQTRGGTMLVGQETCLLAVLIRMHLIGIVLVETIIIMELCT